MGEETHHPVDGAIVEYLHRRVERGNSYVSTSIVADHVHVPVSNQKIGSRLSALESRGYLEVYSKPSSGTVWKIIPEELPDE